MLISPVSFSPPSLHLILFVSFLRKWVCINGLLLQCTILNVCWFASNSSSCCEAEQMDTSMIQSAEPVTVTPKNPPKQRLTVMLK